MANVQACWRLPHNKQDLQTRFVAFYYDPAVPLFHDRYCLALD